MVKAILVRFVQSTDRKPARVVASEPDGKRVTITYAGPESYREAARRLIEKMDWQGEWHEGGLKGNTRVFVCVDERSKL